MRATCILELIAKITASGIKQPIHQTITEEDDLDTVRDEVIGLFQSKRGTNIQVIVVTEWNIITTRQDTLLPDGEFGNERQTSILDEPHGQSRQSASQRP